MVRYRTFQLRAVLDGRDGPAENFVPLVRRASSSEAFLLPPADELVHRREEAGLELEGALVEAHREHVRDWLRSAGRVGVPELGGRGSAGPAQEPEYGA